MPGQDGTGPNAQGPMTGRGMGSCGAGMRRGFGRGMRARRFASCPAKFLVGFTKEEEKKMLEAELKDIETEKQEIEKRLKEIK